MIKTRAFAYSALVLVAILATGILAAAAAPAPDLKPGDKAPAFSLQGTDGKTYDLAGYLKQGKTVVVEWFNPDCPWVVRFHDKASGNTSLKEAYSYAAAQDVVWLAVNSGAPGKQGHGLERNKQAYTDFAMQYPVLLDENGAVGQAYRAKNTPTLFIINPKGTIDYIGGVDDTKTNQDKPGVNYILTALKQYFGGKPVDPAITPHYGCGVKYAN